MHLIGIIGTSHGNDMLTALKLSVYRMVYDIQIVISSYWNFLYILWEISMELSLQLIGTFCTSCLNMFVRNLMPFTIG